MSQTVLMNPSKFEWLITLFCFDLIPHFRCGGTGYNVYNNKRKAAQLPIGSKQRTKRRRLSLFFLDLDKDLNLLICTMGMFTPHTLYTDGADKVAKSIAFC